MSTSAKVQIHLPHGIAAIVVSHDGTPNFMLGVILRALSTHSDELTAQLLLDTYLNSYGDAVVMSLAAKGSFTGYSNEQKCYEYILTGKEFSIYCTEPWIMRTPRASKNADFAAIYPLEYALRGPINESSRVDVAEEICDSWIPLKEMGYKFHVSKTNK